MLNEVGSGEVYSVSTQLSDGERQSCLVEAFVEFGIVLDSEHHVDESELRCEPDSIRDRRVFW